MADKRDSGPSIIDIGANFLIMDSRNVGRNF